jgi:D-alanyl-D-alanine carboxypeptidase
MENFRFFICFGAMLLPGVAQSQISNEEILARLKKAYPSLISSIKDNRLIFTDGFSIVFNDAIQKKSEADLFDHPDIKDMFHWAYPNTLLKSPPTEDPGRIRNVQFFNHIYGDCTKGEVEKNLVDVKWYGGKILKATRINGVAQQLQQVADEIQKAGKEVELAAAPSAGTYMCRMIDGTKRQSAHGFGIAIDVNLKVSDYWRWRKGSYRNRVPQGLVDIFENHGFIWGGKWLHYDTMHFEYRPEMLP